MLYAHPSALTPRKLELSPSPRKVWTSALTPKELGLRGTVRLDVPCHAAVGSPYSLKTLFPFNTLRDTEDGIARRLYFAPSSRKLYTSVKSGNSSSIKIIFLAIPVPHYASSALYIVYSPIRIIFTHQLAHTMQIMQNSPRNNKLSLVQKLLSRIAAAGTPNNTPENLSLGHPLADDGRERERERDTHTHTHTHTHTYRQRTL